MQIVKPSYEIIHVTPNSLKLIERVARTCYKSEDKITLNSAEPFIRNLIGRGHEAMLEFADLHVLFICDRGVTHELVRHRLCSFAQESTRYCDYKSDGIQVICPEGIRKGDEETFYGWEQACQEAEYGYQLLRSRDVPPQIARAVLPTCLKTEIHMKANFREWRHIFKLRKSPAAHPQMRELMVPLLEEVNELIPVIFEDC